MLIADVSQLLDHVGDTQQIEIPYDLQLAEDDYKIISPVELSLNLISTGKSILVQGVVKGNLEATCGRCLKSFQLPFNIDIEEEYKRTEDIMSVTAKDKELGEDDFIFSIDSEGRIDLGEAVRQNVVVNLPLKFVCKKDCQGVIKATKPKQKEMGEADPRLAKLKELKERK
ncbi:DUF177 domain-containing protein [Candidatus Margulisiibacteriota bacterium]